MPRIRTIKPEFWDSPGTARASLHARLFFIALWNWADDYGVGTANPGQLISFAFPNDNLEVRTEFPRLRTEVSECFDVQWYEVDSRPYYYIPSWDSHQKNERRAKGKFPRPDQAIPTAAEMRGISVRPDGSSGIGTGEQGNRGTGEQGKKLTNDSEETHDCNAREFSQPEVEAVGEILEALTGVPMEPLTVAVAIELIIEPASEEVQDLAAYVRASIDGSRDRVIGLCLEARRQTERLNASGRKP